jgi:hypothetical protein
MLADVLASKLTISLYSGCEIVQIWRELNGDAKDLAKQAARSGEVIDICNRNILLAQYMCLPLQNNKLMLTWGHVFKMASGREMLCPSLV